jgi:hypothetical protein
MLPWSADIPAKEMAARTGLGAGSRYRKAGQETVPGAPTRTPLGDPFAGLVIGGQP